MTTYFPSNRRDANAMIGDQKLSSSFQESPFCSGNLMMFMNQDDSEIFSNPCSNEMELIPPLMGILDESNFQGISLSLATQYQNSAMDYEKRPNPVVSSNPTLSSVFIEVAQKLLDEMVSVREALKELRSKKLRGSNGEDDGGLNDPSAEISSNVSNPSDNLSPNERQDLKNRNLKLLSLMNEVDRRYKQYYQQLQILEQSFDAVAGRGASEFYTALAHRTISRHFRRLRDSISAQIEVSRRALGEQDSSISVQEGIPRLRFIDQNLRQQRAVQHLGVTHHCWRPQRGLPESSVSILRAWLFEHFLHPYPKDSEKLKLAKQTGLTRNQVANWFINARVRLWKPMVEEMYKEEFGDSSTDFKSSPENASKASWNNSLLSEDRGDELQNSMKSTDDLNSGIFSGGGDVSLALELKRCEGSGFAMFSSRNMDNSAIVGSMELEPQDFPCLESERPQRRITSSNMLRDFVV